MVLGDQERLFAPGVFGGRAVRSERLSGRAGRDKRLPPSARHERIVPGRNPLISKGQLICSCSARGAGDGGTQEAS